MIFKVSGSVPAEATCGRISVVVGLMLAISTSMSGPAAGEDSATRMMVSGRGHGVLFDGDARRQANVPDGVAESIWKMQGQLTEWRRHLHMHPELSDQETDTRAFIIATLTDMGFKPEPFGPSTGVIVDVPGADTSLTIGVRADIDALPFTEVDDGREYIPRWRWVLPRPYPMTCSSRQPICALFSSPRKR